MLSWGLLSVVLHAVWSLWALSMGAVDTIEITIRRADAAAGADDLSDTSCTAPRSRQSPWSGPQPPRSGSQPPANGPAAPASGPQPHGKSAPQLGSGALPSWIGVPAAGPGRGPPASATAAARRLILSAAPGGTLFGHGRLRYGGAMTLAAQQEQALMFETLVAAEHQLAGGVNVPSVFHCLGPKLCRIVGKYYDPYAKACLQRSLLSSLRGQAPPTFPELEEACKNGFASSAGPRNDLNPPPRRP